MNCKHEKKLCQNGKEKSPQIKHERLLHHKYNIDRIYT